VGHGNISIVDASDLSIYSFLIDKKLGKIIHFLDYCTSFFLNHANLNIFMNFFFTNYSVFIFFKILNLKGPTLGKSDLTDFSKTTGHFQSESLPRKRSRNFLPFTFFFVGDSDSERGRRRGGRWR
jgi:hypothetical protein